MSAETKYKITATDNTKAALDSIKGNLNKTSQAMETFHKAVGITAAALGMGGLTSVIRDAITEGSTWNATLAATKAALDLTSGGVKSLEASFAEGLAPAIVMVNGELKALSELKGGISGWDRIIAGFKSLDWEHSVGALPGINPGKLRQNLGEVEALREALQLQGDLLLKESGLADARARAAVITKGVATAQETFNSALDEMSRLMNRDGVLSLETYTREVDRLRASLFKTAEVKFPAIDTDAILAGLRKPKESAGASDYRWDPSIRYDWDKALDLYGSGTKHLVSEPDKFLSAWKRVANDAQLVVGDMADAMSSAFTDALFEFKSAKDILKGFGQDLLRAIADALILKNLITPLFKGLGLPVPAARASGGPVSAFSPYIVGERGPELFVPTGAGAIVPNIALADAGGVTVHVHLSAIDTRSGMEFIASNARIIGALVQREAKAHGQRGPWR